jgi:hypothetical protein
MVAASRFFKSHASACRAGSAPPVTMIPVDVQNQDVVTVIMVGAMISSQVAAIQKRHDVQLQRLRQLC